MLQWYSMRLRNPSYSICTYKYQQWFFLKKFIQWVAYEKIELRDGKDVEIYENLNFVYYDWHGPSNPTTLKKESWQTFEKFIGLD